MSSTDVSTTKTPTYSKRETKPKLLFKDEKAAKEFFLDRLAELGGDIYTADSGVAYHTDPPNKISLPEGMTPAQGATALSDLASSQKETQIFSHTFKFRPNDGAFALLQVMRNIFGTDGRGLPTKTMWGDIPPQHVDIAIGPEDDQVAQVPTGEISFSYLDGSLILDSTYDPDYGALFQLHVSCPKRYGKQVAGLFKLIELQLSAASIYKGQSISGTDNPKFVRLRPDSSIVYNDDVRGALHATVWGVIENAEMLAEAGQKTNNRVLLEGPYGTGKSAAGVTTSAIANENGWTFIQFHSGKQGVEDLEKTIQTARLYQPAVVFIEDIDLYAKQKDDAVQSRLTNLLDGLNNKDDKVMILMTSNSAASFSAGMLRAGRVDRMIHIGSLDKDATQELLRRVIGDRRLGEVDYEAVWEAMHGYEPAFVRTTFGQATTSAMINSRSSTDYTITTEDFVVAANLLRPQWELHHGDEKVAPPTVEDLLVSRVLTEMGKAEVKVKDVHGRDAGTISYKYPTIDIRTDAQAKESEPSI